MIRGYLTRRTNGLWLLTAHKPLIVFVGDTETQDAYPVPGDPIAFNNMCPRAVELIWGVTKKDCKKLESISVTVVGTTQYPEDSKDQSNNFVD